jgi:hypothetical protein
MFVVVPSFPHPNDDDDGDDDGDDGDDGIDTWNGTVATRAGGLKLKECEAGNLRALEQIHIHLRSIW